MFFQWGISTFTSVKDLNTLPDFFYSNLPGWARHPPMCGICVVMDRIYIGAPNGGPAQSPLRGDVLWGRFTSASSCPSHADFLLVSKLWRLRSGRNFPPPLVISVSWVCGCCSDNFSEPCVFMDLFLGACCSPDSHRAALLFRSDLSCALPASWTRIWSDCGINKLLIQRADLFFSQLTCDHRFIIRPVICVPPLLSEHASEFAGSFWPSWFGVGAAHGSGATGG